jgi:hypothetical protein
MVLAQGPVVREGIDSEISLRRQREKERGRQYRRGRERESNNRG